MVSLDKINMEIQNLEQSGKTTYDVIEKLAMLYTVRDHMEGGDYSVSNIGFRSMRRSGSERNGTSNEVERITSNMRRDEIYDAYNEHMREMRMNHPEEYNREVERLRRNYE